MSKNVIYNILDQIAETQISDIHVIENKPLYARTPAGQIKQISEEEILRDDIRWFLQDQLQPYKLEKILNGEEVDFAYATSKARFRVNAYLEMEWISLAFRKINAEPPTFEEIWLPKYIQKSLLKDKWLILVTWPTGSWKSTTLATMIEFINQNRNVHIITLEDPIEFVFKNKKALITQREIGKHSPSWKDAIKYSLRQDPDVIMVWEMRDLETISAVLTLVETWHLVLSTLHTIDAAQTITRIIDVFPPHQQEQVAVQLSMTLELIISQRLLPTADWKSKVAAREILFNTPAVANNIRQRKIPQIISIMETGSKYWMTTMDRSLAELVAKWIITMEEALPKVKNLETFKILLNWLKTNGKIFKPVD